MNRYEFLTPEGEEQSTNAQQSLDGPIVSDAYTGESGRPYGELFDEPEILSKSGIFEAAEELSSEVGLLADPLKMYMEEISRTKLLTAAEEVSLARRMQAGEKAKKLLDEGLGDESELRWQIEDGAAAKRHMVQANLRLVVSVSKRYRNNGVPLLDLIQEGTLGLIRAAEKFDPDMGFKFSTYATWWIRQAAQRAVANHGRTIRVPVHVVERVIKIKKAELELTQLLGREPTDDEIHNETKITLEKIKEARRSIEIQPSSLNKPVDDSEDASEVGDFVSLSGNRMVEELDQTSLIEEKVRNENIHKLLDMLPQRERQILRWRFGFEDGVAWNLEQIGEELDLTRERVRQLQLQALGRLSAFKEFIDATAGTFEATLTQNGNQLDAQTEASVGSGLKKISTQAEKLQAELDCGLTDGESITLELMINGMDRKQIAKRLHLAESTIKERYTNIQRKTGADTIEEVIDWGINILHGSLEEENS